MTLQPLPSGFPYIWGKFSFFSSGERGLIYTRRKTGGGFSSWLKLNEQKMCWDLPYIYFIKHKYLFAHTRVMFLMYRGSAVH